MKKLLMILSVGVLLISCDNDEKAIDTVTENIFRGGIIRTVAINSRDFDINNLSSRFSIDIEEQDVEDGNLLDYLDVFVVFKDNTVTAELDQSSAPILLERLEKEDFSVGPTGLPIRNLNYDFSELLEATGITYNSVSCKDQFIITLELKLLDGSIFTRTNTNAVTLANNTSASSPFSYTITVLEPIGQNLFTGNYQLNNVQDGAFGPSFISPEAFVEITTGHSVNTRLVTLLYTINRNDPRVFEFTIACDEVLMGKDQLSSICGSCNFISPGRRDCDTGDLILLGPGDSNASISTDDDSVFELSFVEGFDGFDGNCGFNTFSSRIRFTKQ